MDTDAKADPHLGDAEAKPAFDSLRRVGAPVWSLTPYTFRLDQFEGPLEVLLALVQRREVDVHRVQLLEILRQYAAARAERPRIEVDISAEMLALSATLLLIKSRSLLQQGAEEETLDHLWIPSTELLEHLVHYCQLKGATERLVDLEQRQALHYVRPAQPLPPPEEKKHSELEPLDPQELQHAFTLLMAKVPKERGKIHDEPVRISDVLKQLTTQLIEHSRLSLHALLLKAPSRVAQIVLFLACLELMRRGEVLLKRDSAQPEDPYWLEHARERRSSPRATASTSA